MYAIENDAMFLGFFFCEHEMVARGQERFARDAADVSTGAAKFLVFFDKRGLQAELSGADRGDITAGVLSR